MAKVVDTVKEILKKEEAGTTVRAEVTANENVFKADVQAVIAGKDITMEFTLKSNVTWIINGKNLKEGQREDIRLNVEYGGRKEVETTIPDTLIEKIQGGADSCKIAMLEHEGDFSGTVQLKFPVEKKNAGKYANLYYYNETARLLEFQESVKVDGDGMAQFKLTHASQYVINVGEEEIKPTPTPAPALNPAPTASPASPKTPISPKTGIEAPERGPAALLAGIAAVLAIFGIAAALIRNRKK